MLLSALESGRIGDSLLPIVRKMSGSSPNTAASGCALSRTHSDLYTQLAAYCGGYNSGGQKKHRFDVTGALEQISMFQAEMMAADEAQADSSSMLYTVEPPISAFAAPADNLQVTTTVSDA